MIPISARAREREAFAHRHIPYDPSAVEKLEAAVCTYHHCRYAVAFDTPEAALTAALTAAGITAGDIVVTGAMVPLHHYSALARLHARPRYCDIGLNGNLYPKQLSSLVSKETKALLLHAFEGIRPPRPDLSGDITLIDDVTASLAPAAVEGHAVWTLADIMPEGVEKTGFVLTNDEEHAEQLRAFRSQGREQRSLWNYDLVLQGSDTALNVLAAGVALMQMETLASACEKRRENAAALDDLLAKHSLFDLISRSEEDVLGSYPVLLTPQLYCPKEDIFVDITDKDVEASVCCKPVYKTTAYRDDGIRLPVTEDFYKALLQLPCHHFLSTKEVETVAATLRECVEKYSYRGCRF